MNKKQGKGAVTNRRPFLACYLCKFSPVTASAAAHQTFCAPGFAGMFQSREQRGVFFLERMALCPSSYDVPRRVGGKVPAKKRSTPTALAGRNMDLKFPQPTGW